MDPPCLGKAIMPVITCRIYLFIFRSTTKYSDLCKDVISSHLSPASLLTNSKVILKQPVTSDQACPYEMDHASDLRKRNLGCITKLCIQDKPVITAFVEPSKSLWCAANMYLLVNAVFNRRLYIPLD